MKIKKFFKYLMLAPVVVGASIVLSSCSLEEHNPSGYTKENLAIWQTGYRAIVNNCYFGMQRRLWGQSDFGYVADVESDLWTSWDNRPESNSDYFWFYRSTSPNVSNGFYLNLWYNVYDGIGSCNDAISLAGICNMDPDLKNQWLGEAHFMRALYYYILVEQFNGCTITPEPLGGPDYRPEKSDPLTVYKQVIIPDLIFAVENLPKGLDSEATYATKKAALGYLAKAYLSMIRHDNNNTAYASEALKYAKMLIDDTEAGGALYNGYLYPDYADVFKQENNFANREALWKHNWYQGQDGRGASMGNEALNLKHRYFYCRYRNFGAVQENVEDYLVQWGGNTAGNYMPTQHLLSLFFNDDGTLDPRFNMNFQREWYTNTTYSWNAGDAERFEKDPSMVGTTLSPGTATFQRTFPPPTNQQTLRDFTSGDLAIKIIMPQDPDYATELANKANSSYLVVDYKDVYDDANKRILMDHTNALTGRQETENWFRYYFPSLTKFNTENYFVRNWTSRNNGNRNNVFIMRMAEVYLLAAEADLYANGGTNALGYLNKVRARAGAKPLTGSVNLRMIMDESGRELCGEDTRFFDLKRWGMLENDSYLKETHPELAQFFKREYVDRPFPLTFIGLIENGSDYQNPGYQ